MTYKIFESDELDDRVKSLMARLQNDIEKRGWKFYIDPPERVIPAFLKGYHPDALGIGADGGVVIEIKTGRHKPLNLNLAKIAKIIEDQNGWEFRVFHVSPAAEVPPVLSDPTPDELTRGIAEVRTLLETGHAQAALIVAWSLLEAIARLVTPYDERRESRPLSPIQTVQRMAEMGYLEEFDAQRLRKLANLRNVVVHGGFATTVPAKEVAQLIKDLEKITDDLHSAK